MANTKGGDYRGFLLKFFLQLGVFFLAVNLVVQLWRKPTELLSMVGFFMAKTPTETWNSYREYFTGAATDTLSPEFLAALAHLESNGNPWASPRWRVRLNSKPFDIYAPQTTAVGLYQFLDETFRDVSQSCTLESAGNCGQYGMPMTRLSPQLSTQVAAHYLNRELRRLASESALKKLSAERQQTLAAVIHLCGKGKASVFLRSGFSWANLGQCGSHNPQTYVQQLMSLKRVFADLQARLPQKATPTWGR